MRVKSSYLVALALLAAVSLVVGCGGSDDDAASASGGEITIAHGAQPDSLDPALAYTSNSWEPLWLVYTAPLTYARAEGADGAELIPGVATDLPEISDDGKTYSFTVRDGLEYSDGTPVAASDFEHAVKRVLNLESGGTYLFEAIEGATEYIEAGNAEGDISGIETDDETGEVTIRLTAPDGSFSNVLATSFAGLVPSTTPFEDQTKNPPPGVGPYAITESTPNRQFVMERVEGFDIPGIPGGNLDKITAKIVKSPARAAQDVIDGRLDYMQDPPPTDLAAEIRESHSDRYKEWPTLSVNYFFLNQSLPPFDDERVREAVNVALDSTAIARLLGGRLSGSCNIVPAGIPGHSDRDCPFGDPDGPGDVDRAKDLIEEADATGAKVTVWSNDTPTRPEIGQYYTGLLQEIGLDAELKVIDSAVYYDTIGNQKTKAQTGLASWYADFPHPATFVQQVDGTTIQPTNNGNYGMVRDEAIDREIAELISEPDLPAVTDRWEALDERVIDRSHIAPYGSEELTTFMSDRMDFEDCSLVHPLYGNDYSSFCLK